MDACEANEIYQASLRHPDLVTQVVPSPLTFEFDATIQDIVKKGTLGDLIYIEASLHFLNTMSRGAIAQFGP